MSDSASNTPAAAAPARSRGPSIRQLLVVIAILGITVLLTALTSDVNSVLEPGIRLTNGQPDLPAVAGAWRGGELQGLTEEERRALPGDTEGARRIYRRTDGYEVACSVVLAGRDVTSIHRPELCLPGQGWQIEYGTTVALRAAAFPGGQLQVMRMDAKRSMGSGGERHQLARAIFAYWFIGKDRVTAHHWERILWTAKDRVLHNRNHRWAYVLIYAPVRVDNTGQASAESQEQSMQALTSFVEALYPALMSPAS
jgi:EpsI family protein